MKIQEKGNWDTEKLGEREIRKKESEVYWEKRKLAKTEIGERKEHVEKCKLG